jgi:glycosyltransferase involved in cell wall biosynthesis
MPAPASTERADPSATVAIVVAAYQAEPFLAECLQSVLTQSLRSWHLVVVDDGSTDGTLSVARAIEDERVLVLTTDHKGPAHARNLGARAAPPSRYLAILDADDAWDVSKLACQVEFLDQHPHVVAAGCCMRYVSRDGRPLGQTGQPVTAADQVRVARGEWFPFPTPSLIVRQDVFHELGGFDEFLGTQGSEDLDVYARLAQRGRIACLPRVLGSVRIHAGSFMATRHRDVNRAARFVRLRLQARARGEDLSWAQFLRAYRPDWRERRRDLVERAYRRSALSYGQRARLRMIAFFAMALCVDPVYTVTRVYRQRWQRPARGPISVPFRRPHAGAHRS